MRKAQAFAASDFNRKLTDQCDPKLKCDRVDQAGHFVNADGIVAGSKPSIVGLDQKLTDDFAFAVEVIPNDESVEVATGGKENTSLGLFAQSMRETDVFF